MVPNNQLLPKTKTKRKVTEMCGVLGTASRLITSSFNKRQHISKGRINCWAYKKEAGNMEAGQWQKSAPVFAKGI